MLKEEYKVNETLNPKLWDGNKLIPSVRERLLTIADEFISNIEVPMIVVDIELVGSNAAYNYTDTSDIDMHIIVNVDDSDVNKDVLMYAYNLEKSAFNDKYDFMIKGSEVEVYVEDVKTSAISNGIYSIKYDRWIKEPTKSEIADVDVSYEFNKWADRVESVDKTDAHEVQKLLNTVYLIRKNSLAVDGEFGKGNILFKEIRKAGYLDMLKDALVSAKESELSMESLKESMLTEATRNALITKSRASKKGRQRYDRRTKSKVANTVKQFNSIDMNKLFKDNIMEVNISVNGETDDYTVRISFGGFLDMLHDEIKKNKGVLNLKCIIKALITGFNKDDVFIGCSCPDFRYRFGYWTTRNKVSSVNPENRPSDITNPNDTLGSGCKHILLVLSNTSWIIKCASVINNYIKYMSKHYERLYADIIFPAIYQQKYSRDVQLSIEDDGSDELRTDKDTIDKANVHDERDDKGRFTKGNKQGIKFVHDDSKPDEDQLSIEDANAEDDEYRP